MGIPPEGGLALTQGLQFHLPSAVSKGLHHHTHLWLLLIIVSSSPCWSQTLYVVETDPELLNSPTSAYQVLGFRHQTPCLAPSLLLNELMGRHSLMPFLIKDLSLFHSNIGYSLIGFSVLAIILSVHISINKVSVHTTE